MQRAGTPARFGLFGSAVPSEQPFVPLSEQDVRSTSWWRKSGFSHTFILTSARRAYTPIVEAARAAGIWVGIRMDSDGWQSPRQNALKYISDQIRSARDAGQSLPMLRALLKTSLFLSCPRLADHSWMRHFGSCHAICIESPVAADRLRAFFLIWNRPDLRDRVKVLPGPVPDEVSLSDDAIKQNEVLAVGRWQHLQKNASLMVSSLVIFLEQMPAWSVTVVGSGDDEVKRLLSQKQICPEIMERFRIIGRLSRQQLVARYQNAKIVLSTSHAEGFPNVLAEAVCCGCSVVGPDRIASMQYFASRRSGSLFREMTSYSVASALSLEAARWASSDRNPSDFSMGFMQELHATVVSARLASLAAPQALHE